MNFTMTIIFDHFNLNKLFLHEKLVNLLSEELNLLNITEQVNPYVYHLIISMETFCFYGTLQFTFLLALSRYVIFVVPRFNNIFDGIKLNMILILLWSLTACKFEFIDC